MFLFRTILPPDLVRFQELRDDIILHGIQRRKVPMQVHSRIPQVVYQQLVATGQLKPKTHHPMPSTPKPPSKQVNPNQQLPPQQQPGIPQPIPTNPSVPGSLPAVVGNNLNLKNADECRAALEKMKQDIQSHFMNFHAQRQFIQSIQAEAAKKQMPPNMMKDVEIRVQSHYQQMQFHFQKLQQLNVVSEEVNQKLKSFEGETGGLKPHASTTTPNKRVKHGQEIIVPPPAPLYQHVNIQHNLPANSIESDHGKRKRKTSNAKSNNDPQSPRVPQSPGTPNSVTLKNPFGQFPHAEALKTLYRNHLKARDQNALDNNSSSLSDTNGPTNRLPDNAPTATVNTTATKENVDDSVQSSTTNHKGLLTNGGDIVPNGGVLPMNGEHRELEKGGEDNIHKQNASALDHLQKTVNDIEEYSNKPTSPLCNGVEHDSISSSFSSKKRKLSEQTDTDTHEDDSRKNTKIPLKTSLDEISEDQRNGDVVVTNGNTECEKVNGRVCDSETERHQIIETKPLNDISQQNGHIEPKSTETDDTDEVTDSKTAETDDISRVKASDEEEQQEVEDGLTINEKKTCVVDDGENKGEVSTPETSRTLNKEDANFDDDVSMEVDDPAKGVVEPATTSPKDLSLTITTQQQQQPQKQNISLTTTNPKPSLLLNVAGKNTNMNQQQHTTRLMAEQQLSNTTTPSDCSSGSSTLTTPRDVMDSCPKIAAPQLNMQGDTSYWQLNGKHTRNEVFACRWDRCNS